jgi:hypothetical protein
LFQIGYWRCNETGNNKQMIRSRSGIREPNTAKLQSYLSHRAKI